MIEYKKDAPQRHPVQIFASKKPVIPKEAYDIPLTAEHFLGEIWEKCDAWLGGRAPRNGFIAEDLVEIKELVRKGWDLVPDNKISNNHLEICISSIKIILEKYFYSSMDDNFLPGPAYHARQVILQIAKYIKEMEKK